MADSTTGEPLHGRHMACLYSAQVSKGTAVTPATSAGIVAFDVTSDTDMRDIRTIGQAGALFFKPGISRVDFSLPVQAVQTKAILELAERTSGALPWVTFGFGYLDDAGNDWAWQVQDSKIHGLDVSLDAGGLLTATLNGVGGLITELSTFAMAHLSPTPMMSYEAVLTKGGSAYEAVGFRLSINNNVEVQTVIPGAAPSTFKRGWSYQTEGNLDVTGEIVRFAKSGINLQADTISDFAIQLVATDIAGGMTPNTITIALTGAKFGSERIAASPGGGTQFTTPFMAKTVAIS